MTARFFISVLCYNRLELTKKCVESVLAGGGDWHLRIHDNGSTDGTREWLEQLKTDLGDHLSTTRSPINLGFIEPNNANFIDACQTSALYFVTLNNDSEVPAGWLDRIDEVFRRQPAAAIVGARQTCCTLKPDLDGYESDRLEYIEGSAMAVSISVIRKHFSSLFPAYVTGAYFEDSSLSLEVRRRGHTIHQANFVIKHERGSTSSTVPEVTEWRRKNREACMRKWAHYIKHRGFTHRIVVRRWAAAGDVLLTTPIIRALWEQNPLSMICVETYFPELFAGNPCVTFAAKELGAQNGDQVFLLDNSYEMSPMRSIIKSYARCADVTCEAKTEFYSTPEEKAWAIDRLTDGEKPWIAIHPGPSWAGKTWPIERWPEVIGYLRSRGYRVVIVGNAIHPTLAKLVDRDLSGVTTIRQVMPVLARCRLLVTIDSFPLHAAQAMGTPVLGLYGVTSPVFIATEGSTAHAVCSAPDHPDSGRRHRETGTFVTASDAVMRTITVAQVLTALEKIT